MASRTSLKMLGPLLAPLAMLMSGCAAAPERLRASAPPERPNVLVILADDLGIADTAPFGSEIDTPNLTRLAANGTRFTRFHTAPMCSPSRAMLLTGVEQHRTGFGAMAEFMGATQRGQPGYEGYLNDRVVTLAERFRAGGYRTLMAGKWHLGRESLPHRRGFDESVVLLQGAGSHFDDTGYAAFMPKVTYLRDGAPAGLPADFYSSDFYAGEIIRQIDRSGERPFFAYLSFTAPHWPLHAPAEDIAKYRGRYNAGWDVIRARRFAALQQSGVISPEAKMPARKSTVPAWETLSPAQQRHQARLMEVYAAMVDRMDRNIGRVLDHLAATGKLDNTIIVFTSDNGPEATDFTTNTNLPGATDWIAAKFDNSTEALGSPRSYPFYGEPWAVVGAAPHRLYKTYVTEGGTHSPLIVALPRGRRAASTAAFTTMMDIAPTLLEASGLPVGNAGAFAGREEIAGRSMLALLRGNASRVHPDDAGQGFELHANEAFYAGEWKILRLRPPAGDGAWKLYNLTRDPGELNDLAAAEPARLARMVEGYEQYARANNVILRDEPFELFNNLPAHAPQGR